MKPHLNTTTIMATLKRRNSNHSLLRIAGLVLGIVLGTTSAAWAVDRTWTGGVGTTVLNTPGNWSGGAVPGTADTGSWDGTVQTNEPYVWNATLGPTSGQLAASYFVRSGYTSPITLMGNGNSGALFVVSNLVIEAGAGAFALGSNGVASGVAFRANGTNIFINDSVNTATVASDVYFNSGAGVARTILFGGSGNWVFNSPWNLQPAGNGALNLLVQGTGANTRTLTAGGGALGAADRAGNATIAGGTLRLANGDALGTGAGPSGAVVHTVTIAGGVGVIRLALTNDISLNPAVANINIAGRNDHVGATNAAVLNEGGVNTINGIVRFNATGGSNVVLYSAANSLTYNANLTAANVTGDRYFVFGGPGNHVVLGQILNGTANLGIRVMDGTVELNNANTFTGNTFIESGVLKLGNDAALQNSTVVMAGGTLDLNAGVINAPSLGGLSGSGVVSALAAGSSALSVGNGNASSAFQGSINNGAGTVSLQKVGTGTLTLSGNSSYSGGTTVANGTLLANNTTGSGTGLGAVTVNSGASLGGSGTIAGTVDWQAGASATFILTPTTAVAGSNSTPLAVSSSVTLNGNAVVVNVAGGTPLGVGTYRLMNYNPAGSSGAFATATPTYTGAGVSLGTASSISTSGGVVTLTVIYTGLVSVWTNDGGGNWSVGANWSSNPSFPNAAGDSATLGVGSAYTSVALNTPVSVGTIIFTNENSFAIGNAGNSLTFASTAGEAVVSVQAGNSNAIAAPVLLGTNLAVARGTGSALAITNTIGNVGGAQTLTVTGPGTLAISGNNSYGPAAGSVGTTLGGGVLQVGHNNALGAGDLSISSASTVRAGAAVTLPNNVIANAGTTFDNNGNNAILSGTVSGSSSFTKNGVGTLTLNSASSYAGNTTVNEGVLRLGVVGAVPGGLGFGNVTVNTNATLDLNGTSPTLNGLNGAGTVDSTTAGAMTLTVGESGAGGTFTGSIKNTAGTVALVKNGGGNQTLAGNNTYTGGTAINAGTLQIGNGGETGNLGSGPLLNNGNLQFNLAATNVFAGNITGLGTVTLANANLNLWLSGNNTFTGNVINNSGTLWITNSASLGTGPKTVTAVGGGVSLFTRLRLAGNITIGPDISFNLSYNGGVLVNDSGNNTIQGPIAMPNGGGNPLIISSNGLLTLAGPVSTVAGNNARTLTLDGPANGVVSGDIADAGPVASVAKNGAGTWTLSGNNSYTGATTVNGGTLLINGYNAGAGAITVVSNATLGGFGTVSSAVNWQAGSSAAFTLTESGGANTTPFATIGTVALNNNSVTVHVPGGTPLPVGNYILMTYTPAGSSGAFASTPIITGAGVVPNTFYSVITADGVVRLMVVPNSVWVNNGNGDWNTGANWNTNPNVPQNAGDFATFGVGSSFTTVNLNVPRTVGGITFTNANSFNISSAINTLTLNNSGNGAVLTVNDGAANAITAPVALADSAVVTVANTKALSITSGITGTGALTKTGSGALTLSGANSFDGNTTVSGGTLTLGNNNALGSQNLVLNGGSLDSLVPNLVNPKNNAQDWVGDFGFLGSQNLNLGTGNVTMNGNRIVTVVSNTLTVGGSILSGGILTKAGEGTLVLQAPNSMTSVTINAGMVAIGDDNSLSSGTLVFNSATAGIRSVDASPRTLFNSVNASFGGIYGGAGNLTFFGAIASGNFPKTFAVSNALTTFSGPLTDGGAPNGPNFKDGPGILLLEADNSTLTKAMTVNAGTLALGSVSAIGVGQLTMNGGGLDSRVADLVLFGNNAQTWGGDFWFVGTENLNLGTGNIALINNVAVTVSNKVLTVGGSVSGNFALTKAGTGRLVLNGAANNYGNTSVTGGTLEIATATLRTNSLVSVASGAVLQLNFSTTNTVAGLTLNGVAQPAGVYKSTTPGGYLTGPGSLLVVPLGPTGPGYLTNTVVGNQLSLSWPAGQGWRLQVQTNSLNVGLNDNWIYLTDGSVNSTNITINPALPTVFYRLTYP
jgi:fibronectin-binding autotransporter adhesin